MVTEEPTSGRAQRPAGNGETDQQESQRPVGNGEADQQTAIAGEAKNRGCSEMAAGKASFICLFSDFADVQGG